MINYKNVLKNILLKEEEKFFHGLSFIITSLIAIHIVIYFNFYRHRFLFPIASNLEQFRTERLFCQLLNFAIVSWVLL